eukprot:jgi/Psemu1/11122/gm1.11122_g
MQPDSRQAPPTRRLAPSHSICHGGHPRTPNQYPPFPLPSSAPSSGFAAPPPPFLTQGRGQPPSIQPGRHHQPIGPAPPQPFTTPTGPPAAFLAVLRPVALPGSPSSIA